MTQTQTTSKPETFQGIPGSPGVAAGRIRRIPIEMAEHDGREVPTFDETALEPPGEPTVVVTEELLPRLVPVADWAVAVVSVHVDDRYRTPGLSSKTAVVAREKGLPGVVEVFDDEVLETGRVAAVDGDEGTVAVYPEDTSLEDAEPVSRREPLELYTDMYKTVRDIVLDLSDDASSVAPLQDVFQQGLDQDLTYGDVRRSLEILIRTGGWRIDDDADVIRTR